MKRHKTSWTALKTLWNITKHSPFNATISALTRSFRRYRRGVFGDCGVGITPQMCNRVTNNGDMGTFSEPVFWEINISVKTTEFVISVGNLWICAMNEVIINILPDSQCLSSPWTLNTVAQYGFFFLRLNVCFDIFTCRNDPSVTVQRIFEFVHCPINLCGVSNECKLN